MKLQLGNQTSFAAGNVLEPFEFALASRFSAFEFFPDRGFSGVGGWDERDLDSTTRAQIKGRAASQDMLLTVHAPLAFNPLQDPDDDRLYSTIAFASEIGARLIVVHLDFSQGAEQFLSPVWRVSALIAQAGLQLALENTVHSGPDETNRFFELLQSSGFGAAGHIGMCFDMGHANLCTATHNDYCGFLDRLSPAVTIIHLHLHENHGDRDSHLPLFTGPAGDNPAGIVGMLERLEKRGYSGAGIFEQWPHPPSLLTEARDRLVRLLRA